MRLTIFTIFTMSFLNMYARVTIGDVFFDNIHSFTVEESIKEISDKATIVLPKNYKKLDGKPVLDFIKPGMQVTIESGYNSDLQTDFTGFVKPGISSEWPLVIECDELFLLRQNNHLVSFSTIKLKELLSIIIPSSYKIECPDVQLGKIIIDRKPSTIQILNWLHDNYGLFSNVNGNTFYMGWPYDFKPSFTKNYPYKIGYDIKDSKALKFQTDIEFNVQVNLSINLSSGKKIVVKSGSDDPDARIIPLGNRKGISEADAKKITDANLKQNTYSGYTGYVVGFGTPRIHAGDSITIIDPLNLDREGTYLVEKMILDFDNAHISRTSYLSLKQI